LEVAGLAVLVVLGGGALWFTAQWRSRGPDEASVDEAVERFRSSTTVDTSTGALRPTAGVYSYEGDGAERLSFLSTHQPQGPTIPGTVTHTGDGCWTFQIEYNSYHRQTWDWCADDGTLVERGGTTNQQFDFVAFKVDETSVFTCDPPVVVVDLDARPGDTEPSHCRGVSETSDAVVSTDGTIEFVGGEDVDVGGASVASLHYRFDRELSGDQTGSERVDMWFAEDSGLPVRNTREISVESPAPAPLDSVTYTEHGGWRLTSLTPQV
jgi:hypothetical protein